MSRSVKKNPYCSVTWCGDRPGVEKQAKRQARKAQRRHFKMKTTAGKHDNVFPCKAGNIWEFPKDGKQRVTDPKYTRK